ncbi:hypothetical protein P43SY_000734 [Pythium insidiosum]|uniref:Uncharacterized protein n=1 Tax=Pythium insidiosum TaxID=114742 RepID=A0AAD5LPQ3_PYTIN|nr:hypothetical protein P43SY_000734 [Pythium insidiosum]
MKHEDEGGGSSTESEHEALEDVKLKGEADAPDVEVKDDVGGSDDAPEIIEIDDDDDGGGRNSGMCPRCGLALLPAPAPPVTNGLQCRCCLQVLEVESFSRNQRENKPPSRLRCLSCCKGPSSRENKPPSRLRCLSCCKGPSSVLAMLNPDAPSFREVRKRREEEHVKTRERLAIRGKTRVTRALAARSSTPLIEVSREEMEREVRNLKLARRSLQRRRETMDLRGSTRVEYEQQLKKEAAALDSKASELRARDRKLFDELQSSIKIKRVQGIPAKERDGRHRKTKRQRCGAGPTRTPAGVAESRPQAQAQVQDLTKAEATARPVEVDDDGEPIVQWF